MAELVRRAPLGRYRVGDAPAELCAGAYRLAECVGLRLHLLVAPGIAAVPGAVQLSPSEWLVVEEEGDDGGARLVALAEGRTALVQDMSAALAGIDLAGPAAFDLLGIAPLVCDGSGAITTRLAQLRVTILFRDGAGQHARLLVDRFSADYLWAWLAARLPCNCYSSAGVAAPQRTLLDECPTK